MYLASCSKSNSVGRAFGAAHTAIAEHGALPVPRKLRNAVTKLMRDDELPGRLSVKKNREPKTVREKPCNDRFRRVC